MTAMSMLALYDRALRHVARGVVRIGLALTASLAIGSCTSTTVEQSSVATIDLSPTTATVRAGATVAFTAQPRDAGGGIVSGGILSWSSSNKTVATVSASGVVSALSAGSALIAVSAQGKSATSTVTVTPREVASVVVTPPTLSMRVGLTTPLQVQTLDADGASLSGRVVTWQSSNSAVATVSSQGSVTALAVGAATISATSEGRTGQVAITVTLPPVQTIAVTPALDTLGVGTERQHSAVLRDADGLVLTGRVLVWSSNNVAIASVSSAGVVSGVSPGTVTISAASEGRVGTATVVVLARLAGVVTLTPGSATLVVGSIQQLATQVTDADGNLLTGRPVSYTSDAPAVATVSVTGLVTALAPGSARITAVSEGKSGSSTIQVIPVPVASVQVTPANVDLPPGAQQQLTAVARAANGTVLTGRTVTWTSGSSGIVTVSATGLAIGVASGVSIALAVVDGVTAYSTITVSLPPVVSIELSPLSPAIDVSASVQLTATLRGAGGGVLSGRAITWTTADESIAFVSSSGLVLGFKSGSVRITATSEGISASTLVTVR